MHALPVMHSVNNSTVCTYAVRGEREIYFKSHISWWEHSSHLGWLEGASPVCLLFLS